MPEANLTRTLEVAQSIDFVNKFGKQIGQLREMLGVHRVMPMTAGQTIKTYKGTVTLAGGTVAPGAIIPLSEVKVEPADTFELAYDKRRKAVPVEDIQKYGYENAVIRTDAELINELRKDLRTKLFANLAKGTGVAAGEGLQAALAQAWGQVQVAFEDDEVQTIAFINPLDAADYLAEAQISMQTAFGMTYVENFLGVDIVVMSSLVPEETLYATAADNLVLAYAQVDGGEIDKAGFGFVTDESGIIGVAKDVKHDRLTAETTTLSGVVLFAEVLNGVIVGSITAPTPAV